MVDGKELVEGGDLGVRTMKGTVRPLDELLLEDCVARLRIQPSDLRGLGFSIAKGGAKLCWSSIRIRACTESPRHCQLVYAIGDGEESFRTR